MPIWLPEGLSCLIGDYHEQFLGEGDAATCALLPDSVCSKVSRGDICHPCVCEED